MRAVATSNERPAPASQAARASSVIGVRVVLVVERVFVIVAMAI